jgi:diketogulonate reductase-like aldo/keto reductase
VGAAIRDSGVSRHEIFVLSKVGPTFPLGYHDTLQQFDEVRHVFEPQTRILFTPHGACAVAA